MSVTIAEQKCIRCGICIDECPTAAIYYGQNNTTKIIDEDCNDCRKCIAVCVTVAISP